MSVTSRSNAEDVLQWRHVKKISEKLSQEAWRGIALKEALTPALYDQDLSRNFNNTLEAHTLNVVRNELLNALILWCYRQWDRKPDNETLSIPNVVRRLGNKEVCRLIARERSNDWREKHYFVDKDLEKLIGQRVWTDMREAYKNTCYRIDEFLQESDSVRSSLDFDSLEVYRHKLVAHSLEITKIEKKKAAAGEAVEPLRYGLAEQIVDQTAPLIKKLSILVHGIDRDFEGGAQNQKKYAEKFWSAFGAAQS